MVEEKVESSPVTTRDIEKQPEHELEQEQSELGLELGQKQDQIEESEQSQDVDEEEQRHKWNDPHQNIYRLISVNFGFIVLGMSDSSIGVLLPELERYYDLDHLVASVAFISPVIGYIVAAVLSDTIHRKTGRWGSAIIGTSCQLICYIICCCAPPFPVFVVAYGISGLGNGSMDAAWNAWVGSLSKANTFMGFLHAFYGLGGIMCPSIFTAIMDSGRQWNICYTVMIAMSTVSVTLAVCSWWNDTPKMYQKEMEASKDKDQASIKVALRSKLVWTMALMLFMYVGVEVVIGGWLSVFMIAVRSFDRSKSGFVVTGFWTGLTVGRVVLGFVTEKVRHEELSLVIYLSVALGLLVVFWVVNVAIVSAVSIALVGFFIGPAFPIVVVVGMKKLDKWLHISGIGFAASVGGAGAAVLPFVNGVISEKVGPKVLGPYSFSFLAALLITWIIIIKFM